MRPTMNDDHGTLVLTRGPQESLRIGDEVSLTVAAVDGMQVKLAIAAPTSVKVYREEIYPGPAPAAAPVPLD